MRPLNRAVCRSCILGNAWFSQRGCIRSPTSCLAPSLPLHATSWREVYYALREKESIDLEDVYTKFHITPMHLSLSTFTILGNTAQTVETCRRTRHGSSILTSRRAALGNVLSPGCGGSWGHRVRERKGRKET